MHENPRGADRRFRAGAGLRLFLVSGIAILAIPAPAAAYIDPVSGSVLLQIVTAAILAGAVTIGRVRDWLLGLVRRGPKRSAPDDE